MGSNRRRGIAAGIPARAGTGRCDTAKPSRVTTKHQDEETPGYRRSYTAGAHQPCETATVTGRAPSHGKGHHLTHAARDIAARIRSGELATMEDVDRAVDRAVEAWT